VGSENLVAGELPAEVDPKLGTALNVGFLLCHLRYQGDLPLLNAEMKSILSRDRDEIDKFLFSSPRSPL
jgi:hypothetical protein